MKLQPVVSGNNWGQLMSRLASTMAEGRERSKECEGTVRSVCFRDHELGIKHCYCTSQMRRAACFVVFMPAHWVSVIGFLWKDDEGLISRLIYPARSHWDTRSLLPESPGSQHLMKKEDLLCMLLRYQCSLKASVGAGWRSWRMVKSEKKTKNSPDTSSVLACMLYGLYMSRNTLRHALWSRNLTRFVWKYLF